MTWQKGLWKLWADQCCKLHLFKGICCTFVKIYQKDNVQLEPWILLHFCFEIRGWEELGVFCCSLCFKKTRGLNKFYFIWKNLRNLVSFFSPKILVWKYLGKHHNCVCPAETCCPAENKRFFFVIFYYLNVNLLLWRGGSWNLAQTPTPRILFRQTPRKNLKSHETKQMRNWGEIFWFIHERRPSPGILVIYVRASSH